MKDSEKYNKVRSELRQCMEPLCNLIEEVKEREQSILHHLQTLVEEILDDDSIIVRTSVEFSESITCKEGYEFKVVLSWDRIVSFGPVIRFSQLKALTDHLHINDFKLCPSDNQWEIYFPFYSLGVAVGCDETLLEDKE